jgi:7,8-dihydropterin-6-yl-methyl-4-(beta-D-ribofuranosyl)aminobenzene 5'-phosphate synthase
MLRSLHLLFALALSLAATPHDSVTPPAARQGAQRITVLVDAFGDQPALNRQWGYSALIEYGGKRILFDTGNDSAGFAENVHRLGVDLTHLDAVVISHRHGDHTAGLRHLLGVNPQVKIYVPNDEAFGGPTPAAFFQQMVPTLPARMRYFGGTLPKVVPHGSAWQRANFIRVDSVAEIAPGFRLVRNIASTRQFGETPELSLVIDTPKGQVVVVGCSHPGIARILASVAARDSNIAMIVGGLHLVTTAPAEIERLAHALHDQWKIDRIAPGHCTGELAFAFLQQVFGGQDVYAGVGTSIDLS